MELLLGRFVEQPVGLCVLFYQLDAACHVRVITEKNGCIKHFIVSMSSYISLKKITSYKQIRLTPFVFFSETALIADIDPGVDDIRRS